MGTLVPRHDTMLDRASINLQATRHLLGAFSPAYIGQLSDKFADQELLEGIRSLPRHIDLHPAYIAIEEGFYQRHITAAQAIELQRKISRFSDTYEQKIKMLDQIREVYGVQCQHYNSRFDEQHVREAQEIPERAEKDEAEIRSDLQRYMSNLEYVQTKHRVLAEERDILENTRSALQDKLEEVSKVPIEIQKQAEVVRLQLEHLESAIPVHLDKLRKVRRNVEDSHGLEIRMKRQIEEAQEGAKKHKTEIEDNKEVCMQYKGAIALLNVAIAAEQKDLVEQHKVVEELVEKAVAVGVAIEKCEAEVATALTTRNRLKETLNYQQETIDELERKARVVRMRYQAAKNEKAGAHLILFQAITRLRQGKQEKTGLLREKDVLTMRKFKLDLDIGRQRDFNRRTKANVEDMMDKVAQYEEDATSLKQAIKLIARRVTLYSICVREGNHQARTLLQEEETQMKQLWEIRQEATDRWREHNKTNKEMFASEEHLRNSCTHLNEERHEIALLHQATEQYDLSIHNLECQLARRLAIVAELRKEFMSVESGKQDDLENVNVVRGILQEHRDRMAFMQKEWRDLSSDFAKILKHHAAFTVAIPRAYQENHRLQVCVLDARAKYWEAEAELDRAVILVHRLQQDFEISMIKCENLLEYCGTVSERRIVDVAAFVDSTLEFMLRSGEISLITKHMVHLENQHRELDRYIEWLQKVVVLDVKLLYREMRWEKLCRYYERIHAQLQQKVIDTVRRRNLLFLAATTARDCGVNACAVRSTNPEEEKEVLQGKLHHLQVLHISMDRRFLTLSVHFRLVEDVTKEMIKHLDIERAKAALDQAVVMNKRSNLQKVKSQNKLAMVDVGAAIQRLKSELVLSDDLKELRVKSADRCRAITYRVSMDGSGDG